MNKGYSANRPKDFRRVRPEIVVVAALALALILGSIYLYLDIKSHQTVIDNSRNRATLGSVDGTEDELVRVDHPLFELSLPSNWIRLNNPEKIIDGKRYYPHHFSGTKGNDIGRHLHIYVDEIPALLAINKVREVEIMDNRYIIPGELSEPCYKFTDFDLDRRGEPYASKWKGYSFTCDTSHLTNVTAAIETSQSQGLVLTGPSGTHRVLIVYTDHGSLPNDHLFNEMLESLRLK